MYSQIRTSMLDGICTMPVQVEVDISMGMPVFDMVGYLSPEVREAKERVRTALHNCGILLPAKRITVNLSPANIRKTGTGFDLPIAVALLVLSYSLILQPRYEEPENSYDLPNDSCKEINGQNSYLYEIDGKYYLHYERGDVPIDKKSMELFKKAGLKFEGGN